METFYHIGPHTIKHHETSKKGLIHDDNHHGMPHFRGFVMIYLVHPNKIQLIWKIVEKNHHESMFLDQICDDS